MPTFLSFISVAAGGAIGATARFSVYAFMAPTTRFPWPTLSVNVLGCFMAGILGTWLIDRALLSANLQLFLITGVLGGFTTFSAFSLDTLRLAESGQLSMALVNVLVNVCGSLIALIGGWWLAKVILI